MLLDWITHGELGLLLKAINFMCPTHVFLLRQHFITDNNIIFITIFFYFIFILIAKYSQEKSVCNVKSYQIHLKNAQHVVGMQFSYVNCVINEITRFRKEKCKLSNRNFEIIFRCFFGSFVFLGTSENVKQLRAENR